MNLKNIVVSVGLAALLSSPVFANDTTTHPTEGGAAAGEAAAHPDHGKKKASVTKTKGKKGKTTEAAPAAPAAEGAHPEHPPGN